ncbi:phosphotransferase family protein [Jiangella asiatica]|uniref:Aminoglycoside phosphotransferase family protein n=1 Tax=Jiangella asiatica TaxID=2530372 RepID=A0A4R5CSV8_9ACTN|nr:aminoglycoside phosphotransferase family protein [Jiangella asiatica]TDE01981.1 aminoglycoside phosphotransferase family protein [Jiangella asiatica]
MPGGATLTPAAVIAAGSRVLGQELRAATRVPLGWGGENWRVQAVTGERFLVKAGEPESARKWSATRIAYDLARQAGVPVPRHLRLESRCPEAGGAALRVFSWVDGVDASSVLEDATVVPTFFGELGSALRRLHSIQVARFSSRLDGSAPSFGSWGEYVEYRLPQIAERVAATGAFTPVEFATVTDRIIGLTGLVNEVVSPSLCHRDLYLDNLLATEDGHLAALLDFDLAEAWDAAVDLVKLRWLVFPARPGAQAAFDATYHGSDPPPLWEHRIRLTSLLELTNTVANARAKGDARYEAVARTQLRAITPL